MIMKYIYGKRVFSYLSAQVVHWQSPHMHAYYPSLTSWPSMLGDMLADAINCVGFTWVRNDQKDNQSHATICFSDVLLSCFFRPQAQHAQSWK